MAFSESIASITYITIFNVVLLKKINFYCMQKNPFSFLPKESMHLISFYPLGNLIKLSRVQQACHTTSISKKLHDCNFFELF